MAPQSFSGAATRIGAAALFLFGICADGVAAQTCPDVGLSGRPLSYSAGQLTGAGQTVNVMAGGNVDLRGCASVPGHGWIIEGPDFELMLSAMPPGQSLTLSVDGTCDAVLLVNDARGRWHYNDDAGGTLDPLITLPGASNGVHDIWVGTFGAATCPATLTLHVSGTGAAPPPPPSNVVRFDLPRVRGELVDWCVTWGADCGQGGADNFCRSQGYARAESWERFPGQRTLVLGDDRICPGGCDALRDVVCTGSGGAAPPPPPSLQQTFAVPRVRGEIVDWCVTWGADCGQGGADNFCRSHGYARAESWERFPGQRTLVLGDDRICPGGCDGLRNVVCTD
ncbi:hypothetical protein roselon_02483 [Roseibacterium elongatum DSM 19469]|uniref:Uncharacterized protein n=1 Tax=Roseicyclus elongatus DSM 19469 TaxID=1294273 RepID=W8RUA7_9RHOB|nr:hypothetical protein [Roseibacterium elongatum]AHM04804.1 hypothetical protein roselon_02483 [Roseibacterium elongatum DSM 19469]